MSYPTLELKDGFASVSPDLRDDVALLQQALQTAGYSLDSDGLFGKGTEDAVKNFQRNHGLVADGIVGAKTWAFLKAYITEEAQDIGPAYEASDIISGFHGNLSWVHEREGHAGKTYWPGGASGVTLDPGVDLGYADPFLVEAAYKPLLSKEHYKAAKIVLGIKGEKARKALAKNATLRSITITKSQADKIFPYAAQPYWKAISQRFSNILKSDTPGSVHTVMLSLAYNRGAGNRRLNVLASPIENKNWLKVADIVGAMQQDHKLAGIRKRRRMEAELIRKELQ